MVYKPDQPHRTICLTLGMLAAAFPDSTLHIRKKWLPVFYQGLTALSHFVSQLQATSIILWTTKKSSNRHRRTHEITHNQECTSSHVRCTSCHSGGMGPASWPSMYPRCLCWYGTCNKNGILMTDISKICILLLHSSAETGA